MSQLAAPFDALRFVHPWRTYQELMLSRDARLTERRPDQHTRHLVAPPGSGKTIVGLELIRRRAAPAVVLSPTATIAAQWLAELELFTPDEAVRRAVSSGDPAAPAAITSCTYQRLAVLDRDTDGIEARAAAAWEEQLVADGRVHDHDEAAARLATMAANHPANHRRELARRSRSLRRALLRGGEPVEPFLHPNARAALDALVAAGVRTVVLDECHHLLDHWALVVRALIDRITARDGHPPRVIGLTATLPSPDDPEQLDTYLDLLGDVDFEVPVPAVVKEGDLAPWRDLVYFVQPTPREAELLDAADERFLEAAAQVLDTGRVTDWALREITGRGSTDAQRDAADHAADHLRLHPMRWTAQARWLLAADAWPTTVPRPADLDGELSFDDRLTLIEAFALDVLALSDDPADHDVLTDLRAALGGFGLSLTERGLRQGRSAGDVVLSLSAAKDAAVVDILTREAADLGDRLRAVVVTDFAEMSSAADRASGALDADAGSAWRVFHALIDDPACDALEPMLVTGSTVLVDADHGDALVAELNAQLEADGLRASCAYRETGHPRVLEIVGSGPGWTSATYVRLLTEVLESGATRCLVGTRGLFGEGWNALSLNTLIDLTAVTTSTSVQQLRGRSIRLDPAWPRKVAHDWDVICVAPQHPRGDVDLRRLVRRHGRTWGVVPPAPVTAALQQGLAAASAAQFGVATTELAGPAVTTGEIRRGTDHLSRQLTAALAALPFRRIRFGALTRRSLAAIGDRDASYDLWNVGGDYDAVIERGTELQARDLSLRTVARVQETLTRLVRAASAALAGALVLGLLVVGQTLPEGVPVWIGFPLGALVVLLVNRRTFGDLARELLLGQPPDAILRDLGRAVRESLYAAQLISDGVDDRHLRIRAHGDGTFEVVLEADDPEEGEVFRDALRQVLGDLGDPRYLIRRTDGRLPNVPLRALWYPLRTVLQPALGRASYHAVPDLLGVNRERAESFARAWSRHVGGGELVYTRNDTGRRILLEARAGSGPRARSVAFERWR